MKSKSKKNNFSNLINKIVSAGGRQVKLGIDLHARDGVVCAQVDGSVPQRPMRLSHAQVEKLVRELVKAGLEVVGCYEAGPCGFWLARKLIATGATIYVVAPVSLSDGRRQKTDGLDARALVDQLDRFLRGNKKAFTPVRVPTQEEEQRRAQSRLREQIKHSRTQWVARARSLLLTQGFHVKGCWWGPRNWKDLRSSLPEWLAAQVESMREIILKLDADEKALRKELVREIDASTVPVGIGVLTWVLLLREVCDWGRFNNRREVAGFTGLCAGVDQSGGRRRELSINRHGNPRIRALLIEAVWRLVKWQPNYPPVRQLLERMVSGRARRKIVVAAARKLAIDLWRLATGQTTAEKLGLRMPAVAAAN